MEWTKARLAGRKRPRESDDGSSSNEDAVLPKKSQKIFNNTETGSVLEATEGPSITVAPPRPPIIRKPLINSRFLSRLNQSTLLVKNRRSSGGNGKKSFKRFRKVLPKFVGRLTSNIKEGGRNDPNDAETLMNISINSLRFHAKRSIKMIRKAYSTSSDINGQQAAPKRHSESKGKSLRQTLPRKMPDADSETMPPPPPRKRRPMLPDKDDDGDDMWSFN